MDAVCMGQASEREKECQVKKMHHIYRRAKCIYVWLGKAEERRDDDFDAINEVVF